MDELELLKKHWQKDVVDDKQLTSQQIYPMLLKKSSSIVKTLFYISIAELLFWLGLSFLPLLSSSYQEKFEHSSVNGPLMTALTIFTFIVISFFIFLLFKAHRNISVTDNAKKLMESIIKTRKIIKYYVLYNLIMVPISMVLALYYVTKQDTELAEKISHFTTPQLMVGLAIFIIFTIVFIVIIWLFYRLIYGILMKRLNRNYEELKKLHD
ncbi:hypothetical protein [Pontimicrobium sp. MEBiC01747]